MKLLRISKPPPLPPRPKDGHKGVFGRVLVVGGNDDMLGAPVLAGTAALRMGAGLVQIAVPRAILPACLSVTPELIGLGLTNQLKPLLDAAEKADALVVGPGLGQGPGVWARVKSLIALAKPMVLDADALNLLAAQRTMPRLNDRTVLTPHPGEMKRLLHFLGRDDVPTDDAGRLALAADAARTFGCVVILKGHRTAVSDGRRAYLNRTGDSSLSKGGTGDVLAGMLGTLLAQNLDPFTAACIATDLHGRAGERAGQKLGRRSVLARDVIDAIAAVVREHKCR
jgi:hydroxyethylthiazole kinase-like uncharacterized protein yjeF